MKIGTYFTLEEMTRSSLSCRLNISNNPDREAINHLKSLVSEILDPIRHHYDCPLIISSGYRSVLLNQMIGSSIKSQHLYGQAADFRVLGISHEQVVLWVKSHLVFDQLILEFYKKDDPSAGWIHISYMADFPRDGSQALNRQQTLIYDGENYRAFL